jgi:nucleoid-associated protein YgaU
MLLTDLNGPMPLKPRRTGLRRTSRARQFAAPAILFLSVTTFGAAVSRAQDQQKQSVAEAARQERTRKQELQKRAKHVYTEEDLKHPNILTPEDRAQVEAKRNECAQKNNCSPAPAQNPPASLDANSQSNGTSLGEVARQLRKQKELQALKPKQTEPFHLPFSAPALASPILPERPAIRPPAQPILRPKSSSPKISSNVFRRDPFSPAPIRPEVRKPEIRRPEVRAEVPPVRPEVSPAVRENLRPEVRTDAHASVHENIRPTIHSDVQPKVRADVNRKDREDALPAVRPSLHLKFSKDVRPTFRAHRQPNASAQPKISSGLAAPGILIQPVQPVAPSKPSEPSAPVSTIRRSQPHAALNFPTTSTLNTISVTQGDSLWKLAQQTLGRGNRWPKLLAVNPGIANPNQIRAGAQLNLPSFAVSAAVNRSANTNATATIKVRKGDTLWTLAKSRLGHSSYWPCLAAANASLRDPNRIYHGQILVVPPACAATAGYSLSRASPNPNPRSK